MPLRKALSRFSLDGGKQQSNVVDRRSYNGPEMNLPLKVRSSFSRKPFKNSFLGGLPFSQPLHSASTTQIFSGSAVFAFWQQKARLLLRAHRLESLRYLDVVKLFLAPPWRIAPQTHLLLLSQNKGDKGDKQI